MPGDGRRVAQDEQLHAGPGDRYVHASQVVEEADPSPLVCPNQADEDDVALLSLKTVDRMDRDQFTQRAEKGIPAYELPEILDLGLIGRDHPEIDSFVQDTFLADLFDVIVQLPDGDLGFRLVNATSVLRLFFLRDIEQGGIDRLSGGFRDGSPPVPLSAGLDRTSWKRTP